MKAEDVKAIVRAALFTPGRRVGGDGAPREWGLPLILWGPPGVGKTTGIKAIAEARGLRTEIVVLGQTPPEDVGGYPLPPSEGDGVMKKAPASWAARAASYDRALVLLDEFTVDPDRQAAALSVLSGCVF